MRKKTVFIVLLSVLLFISNILSGCASGVLSAKTLNNNFNSNTGVNVKVLDYDKVRNSNSYIGYLETDEFPELPSYEKDDPVIISQFSLKELIRTTIFSTTENESNKIRNTKYIIKYNCLVRYKRSTY